MNISGIFKITILFSIFCFLSMEVRAQGAFDHKAITQSSGIPINIADEEIEDHLMPPRPFSDNNIIGKVTVGINYFSNQAISVVGTPIVVDLQITSYTLQGNVLIPETVTKTATIEMIDGMPQTDIITYTFDGAYKLDVLVTNVSPAPESNTLNLFLESEITVDRKYDFDRSVSPSFNNVYYDSQTGEIVFEWDGIPEAISYDLEWTHINDIKNGVTDLSLTEILIRKNIFDINSSRVNLISEKLVSPSYRFPCMYDQGYILYRIRGRGYPSEYNYKKQLPGNWSYNPVSAISNPSQVDGIVALSDFNSSAYYKIPSGHEAKLNWQVTTSFAEEGKSKSVINYYDGSFRNRQSVTKMNTDNTVVVGETKYDYEGRSVVNILPVPTDAEKIRYFNDFNLYDEDQDGVSDGEFNKEDFDTDANYKNLTGILDKTSGASRYYSENSDFINSVNGEYIPDAEGYPFTRTIYTPDNTGRVKTQVAPGAAFQIKTNEIDTRTTDYLYGSPAQEDLDELFGSEIGYAEFYKKTSVSDPNKVVSASYTDAAGNVVATAMSAYVPNNMLPVSESTSEVTRSIIRKTKEGEILGEAVNEANGTKTLYKPFTADQTSNYTFDYSIETTPFYITCNSVNDYGEEKTGITGPYNPIIEVSNLLVKNDEGGTLETILNGTLGDGISPISNPDISVQQSLSKGEYSITRTLKINEDELDRVAAEYAIDNPCVFTEEYYINHPENEIDFAGCLTCDMCQKVDVEGYENWIYNPDNIEECDPLHTDYEEKCPCKGEVEEIEGIDVYPCSPSAYDAIIDLCYENCEEEEDEIDPAEQVLNSLLQDMSPNGQYGLVKESGKANNGAVAHQDASEPYEPWKFRMSIYNEGNELPLKNDNGYIHPSWRRPMAFVEQPDKSETIERHYYEDPEMTQIAYVTLTIKDDGSYSPDVREQYVVEGNKVEPQYLRHVSDFLEAWKPNWARSLVAYHPEYGFYELIKDELKYSYIFDNDWLTADFDEIDKKFGISSLIAPDVESSGITEPSSITAACIDFQSFDGLFNGDCSISDHGSLVYAMKKAMAQHSFGTDGITRNIWEITNMTVNRQSKHTGRTCTPEKTEFSTLEIDCQEEWEIFRSLYHSLKKKVLQRYMIKKAIDGRYYNGCIGKEHFNPGENFFDRWIVEYPMIHYYAPPYYVAFDEAQFFNLEQPCNCHQHWLYKDKEPRFATSSDVLDIDEMNNQYCAEDSEVAAPSIDPICFNGVNPVHFDYAIAPCLDEQLAISDALMDINARMHYQTCGQCPIVPQLEDMFNGIIDNESNKLESTSVLMECVDYLSDDLWEALGGGDAEYSYTSSDGTSLEFSVNATNFTGSFRFDDDNVTEYTFEDIQNICCVQYEPDNPYANEGYDFSFMATVPPIASDYLGEDVEYIPSRIQIKMYGQLSGIDIDDCASDFDAVCKPNDLAYDFMFFFNGLLTEYPGLNNVPVFSALNSIQIAEYSENPTTYANVFRYEKLITENMKELLGLTHGDYFWETTTCTANSLDAIIKDVNGVTLLELEFTTNDVGFSFLNATLDRFVQVVYLENEEPNYILLKAREDENSSLVDIICEISSGTLTQCGDGIPGEYGNEKDFGSFSGTWFCAPTNEAETVLSELNSYIGSFSAGLKTEISSTLLSDDIYIEMSAYKRYTLDDVIRFENIESLQEHSGNNYGFIVNAIVPDRLEAEFERVIPVTGYTNLTSMAYCVNKQYQGCVLNEDAEMLRIMLEDITSEGNLLTTIDMPYFVSKYGFSDCQVGLILINGNEDFSIINSIESIIPTGSSDNVYTFNLLAKTEQNENEIIFGSITNLDLIACEEYERIIYSQDFEDTIYYDDNYLFEVCTGLSCPSCKCLNPTTAVKDFGFTSDHQYVSGYQSDPYNTYRFRYYPSTYPEDFGKVMYIDGEDSYNFPDEKFYRVDYSKTFNIKPYRNYVFRYKVGGEKEYNVGYLVDGKFNQFPIILEDGIQMFGFDHTLVNNRRTGRHIGTLWNQLTISIPFSSENNTEITIQIVNYDDPKGPGNDYFIDDIELVELAIEEEDNQNSPLCNLPDFSDIAEDNLTAEEIELKPCIEDLINITQYNARVKVDNEYKLLDQNFRTAYIKKAFENIDETYTMTYDNGEHQYTLYYYDLAGNLVKTVPPEGVADALDSDELNEVEQDRFDNTQNVFTNHTMATRYKYNSLNQLVAQYMPDHDAINYDGTQNINDGIPNGGVVKDVNFTSETDAYAIVKNGELFSVYLTNDGGNKWVEASRIGNYNLNKVKYITGEDIITVGQFGTVLFSNDAGVSWENMPVPTSGNLVDFIFTSPSEGMVFEQDGTIWMTFNAGTNWEGPIDKLSYWLRGNLEAVEAVKNQYIAVSDKGEIFYSNSSGFDWSESDKVRYGDLGYIGNSSFGTLAAGNGGTVIRRINSSIWEQVPLATSENIKKIYETSTGIQLLTQNNVLLFSSDNGDTWTMQYGGNVLDLEFVDDNTGYLLTTTQLLGSTDGGANWTSLNSHSGLSSGDLNPRGNTIYFGGNDGKLFAHYVGFGVPVSEITTGQSFTIKELHIHNYFTGTILTGEGKIYNSTNPFDPSPNWTCSMLTGSSSGADYRFEDMDFSDGLNGVVVDSKGVVCYTEDGGLSWAMIHNLSNLVNNNMTSIVSASPETMKVVGEKGEIWTTVDKGQNWRYESGNVSINRFYDADITAYGDNAKTFFAVGEKGAFIKSEDGINWTMIPTSTFDDITCLDMEYAEGADRGRLGTSSGKMFLYTGTENSTGFDLEITDNHQSFIDITLYNGVGEKGAILDYNPSNELYVDGNTEANFNLNSISNYPEEHKFTAVGEYGVIYTSSDAGETFDRVADAESPDFVAMEMLPGGFGFALSTDKHIYQTSNEGRKWSSLFDFGTVYGGSVSSGEIIMKNRTDGVVLLKAGTNSIAFPTSSGFQYGSSGDVATPFDPKDNIINDITYFEVDGETHWVVVGDYGFVAVDWVIQNIYNQSGSRCTDDLTKLYFVNPNTAYAVGENSAIYKITDEGLTWTEMPNSIDKPLTDVYFTNASEGFVTANDGFLYNTTDGGDSWSGNSMSTGSLEVVKMLDDEYLLVAGANGMIKKTLASPGQFSAYFYYDELGRVIASQNAKQVAEGGKYSYTIYDALGRTKEAGEIEGLSTIEVIKVGTTIDYQDFLDWLNTDGALVKKKQVIRTIYDNPASSTISAQFGSKGQENLRNRVASVMYFDEFNDIDPLNYNHATHYSYDIHGNVKTLIQDMPELETLGHRYKTIDYKYDLISGNVLEVLYQDGEQDAFYHRYEYDDDNRIVYVETSKDYIHWDNDAIYEYYKHGPLARTELGGLKVQGIDYAYTLQGWIKGVNSDLLDPTMDIGKDGGTPEAMPADAYGYSIGYFDGDYTPIGGTEFTVDKTNLHVATGTFDNNLYNGNISNMVTTIRDMNTVNQDPIPMAYLYKYDVLNRIKDMDSYKPNTTQDAWDLGTTYYQMEVPTYDRNGNIENLKRTHSDGTQFDDFTYHYEKDPATGKNLKNKLLSVSDAGTTIPDFGDLLDQGANNYAYDAMGNLIQDVQEEIQDADNDGRGGITWSNTGKVLKVERDNASNKVDLVFTYDAIGNRISKTAIGKDAGQLKPEAEWVSTWYVRDASGNIMARYKLENSELYLTEQPVYGSSRLGMYNPPNDILMDGIQSSTEFDYSYKFKNYELSNHLNNVLTTVSGHRDTVSDESGNIIAWNADILTTSDYYPFGMEMPGKTSSSDKYNYGFNGMEKEAEITGSNSHLDFGARIYDSRIGRWMSIDPAFSDYPGISDYSFVINNPIIFIDPDGKKVYPTNDEALEIIKLGLSPEEAEFVVLDENNFIDLKILRQGKDQLGSVGLNYESLLLLVDANEIIEVTVSETMIYKDSEGQIKEDKYSNTRDIERPIDDLWVSMGGNEDFSGKVMTMEYNDYVKYMENMGESNEEPMTFGKVGETLYPISEGESPSGHYSTNENIQVHATNKVREVSVVKTQAHESYGHALFKVLGKPSSHGSSLLPGVEGANDELEIQIHRAEKEAEANYEKH